MIYCDICQTKKQIKYKDVIVHPCNNFEVEMYDAKGQPLELEEVTVRICLDCIKRILTVKTELDFFED